MTCRHVMAPASHFGDSAAWARWFADPAEIYLWRAEVDGAVIADPRDAQLILRAVAKAQELRLDERAIVVGWDKDQRAHVDVVLSADSLTPYLVPTTAELVAQRAQADETLRQRFPNLRFVAPVFLELTGPADAVDFWKAHPIVWDDKTGPLDAFAKLQGIYRGAADDGPRAQAWSIDEPKLDGKKPGEPSKAATLVLWALGGAMVAWIGAKILYA